MSLYLTQGLHRALQRSPQAIALRHLDADGGLRAWTFAEHLDRIARRAAALRAMGVGRGDRVALLGPNDDRLVQAIVAAWWLGAAAVPLNTRWSAAELAQALADCEPARLVVDAGLAPLVAGSAVPTLDFDALAAEAERHAPLPDTRSGDDTLATLLYTGGTTGRSKGVMLTHANFWTAAVSRGAELPNSPDSLALLVAPLFHVAGLSRLIGQTVVGGGCLTMAQFRPAAVLAAIEAQGITDTIVVPTMLQALLDEPGFAPQRVRSLNRIAFGAAPMPPDLLARALAAWPQAEFFQAYGLTETAGAVCINLPENHRSEAARAAGRLHSVGRAGLGAEILVADEDGRACPRGTVGEVCVRGPMVTAGYWRHPEATRAAFRDGWFRTGDAGRMDDAGYLWIVDRLKDMIITGGENVYGAEVEAVLRAHPDVAQAAVIGLPDAHWGERVHAVVVPAAGVAGTPALAEALRAWCRERLAGYKCPRGIGFAPELPLSAAGKVLKNELRRRCAD
ncbi:AMP-binding protein [Piscinibacter sakaiensis]|uniref:Long-chain-fatty-acid--CoA ligase n=1 Tax=Piscinibacter sakaiensis TaxID=1547922 RepID=A0A0K8P3K3_PISS1|nr:AMP-binding protein [Piscinibacter sakaiensis]GAP37213.1 long-chain-fatty-acid--CoA ligase [Piscinibacter sakaiensis]